MIPLMYGCAGRAVPARRHRRGGRHLHPAAGHHVCRGWPASSGSSSPARPSEVQVEAAPLEEMNAHVLQVTIPENSKMHGVYVSQLRLPAPSTIALLLRDGEPVTVTPNVRLQSGDQLLIVAPERVRAATERRLRAIGRGGALAIGSANAAKPSTEIRSPKSAGGRRTVRRLGDLSGDRQPRRTSNPAARGRGADHRAGSTEAEAGRAAGRHRGDRRHPRPADQDHHRGDGRPQPSRSGCSAAWSISR